MDEIKSRKQLKYLRQNSWKGLIPGHIVRYKGEIPAYEGLTLMLKGVTDGENPEPCFNPVRLEPPNWHHNPTANYFLSPPGDPYRHIGMLPLFYEGGDPIKQVGVKFLSAKREDFEIIAFPKSPQFDRIAKELREALAGTK